MSESIERYIEDEAFSLSYDLAPPPTFSCKQVVSLSQHSRVSSVELSDWRGGEGVEEKPNNGEKAWPSINH